jgi:hypothetical protein
MGFCKVEANFPEEKVSAYCYTRHRPNLILLTTKQSKDLLASSNQHLKGQRLETAFFLSIWVHSAYVWFSKCIYYLGWWKNQEKKPSWHFIFNHSTSIKKHSINDTRLIQRHRSCILVYFCFEFQQKIIKKSWDYCNWMDFRFPDGSFLPVVSTWRKQYFTTISSTIWYNFFLRIQYTNIFQTAIPVLQGNGKLSEKT